MFRICVDLDNTICHTRKENEKYEDVLPIEGAIETLRKLKEEGCYIIIFTARNMRTFEGNIGKINKYQMPIIQEWLKKYEVPHDEIILGKPHVNFFIDDKGIEFRGDWNEIEKRIKLEMKKSEE
jgi:capsule biosynthesis phosphatase